MYQPLLSQIEEAKKRSAKFYKADLHIHTYDSEDDYPRLGDKLGCATKISENDKVAKPPDFIKAGKKAQLQLMAITDHNKSKVAEQISKLSDHELLILPGMEVSLKTGFFPDSVIHILVIFPENYTCADIERVFAKGNMPIYSMRKYDSVLDISINEFIDAVHLQNGICIASHVNSDKGIRSHFRGSNIKLLKLELRKRELQKHKDKGIITLHEENELKNLVSTYKAVDDAIQNQYLQFLAEHRFDAIEIQSPDHRQYYSGTHVDDLGIRPISCVMGSDSHNLGDVGLSGYTTYFKMTTPSHSGIKKALLDPGTRIRFENEIQKPPIARIFGVQFDGGYFQNHIIGFADNLTCLIGGRGSGKSALIEAIRYLFEIQLPTLSKEKLSDISGRLEHTLSETDVKAIFSDPSGDTYILKRRYGEVHTSCYDINGDPHGDVDISVASNLRLKIYGWGEIEALARSKREQLTLIDGFIPDVKLVQENADDCMQVLKNNTGKIISLAGEIKTLLPRVAELPTKRELLYKLSSEELNIIFKDFDRNQSAQTAIESICNFIVERKQFFCQDDESLHQLRTDLLDILVKNSECFTDYDWFISLQEGYKKLAEAIQREYDTLIKKIDTLLSLVEKNHQLLIDEGNNIEANLNRIAEEANTTDAKSILARRRSLTEEVGSLQTVQDQIDQKQREITRLLADRTDRLIPLLNEKRSEVTQLRQSKLKEINDQLQELTATAKISINLEHQKEKRDFILALGTGVKGDPDGILKGGKRHYIADKYAENYAIKHSPHTFVNAVFDMQDIDCEQLQLSKQDNEGNRIEIIPRDRAIEVKKHLYPQMEEATYFDPDRLKKLLELEHCDTVDLVQISLDGHPIEDLSPGQRCSALIPIILLESNCPLIIDQPEDNLDNKLVFNLVVDIMRGLKERRQIIVATHNPNIPVSGDAEQIVVFEAHSKDICNSVISGSIDCDDIVDQVKAIMEGSEEAFRIRAEKYGFEMPVQMNRIK